MNESEYFKSKEIKDYFRKKVEKEAWEKSVVTDSELNKLLKTTTLEEIYATKN